MSEKLAINGGTPIRSEVMPSPYPGASAYGQEEIDAAVEVLKAKSPFRYYGPSAVLGKAKEFEKSLSTYIGVNHTLGVTSCTASLVVALKAAGVGIGDKVIIPACTFIATAGAVVAAGAVPVFCDIDDSFTIDPKKIGACVDKYTKALIAVPILGNPCRMDEIMEEAKKYNLMVIEDVAQSMGSTYKGKKSGSFGDLGCFSMQINKMISTGEGGAVCTNDPKLYERAVRYHDHGMFREREGFLSTNAADDIFLGQNYRMSEITGAIATAQLKKLPGMIEHFRKLKKIIVDGIKDIPGIQMVRVNDPEGECGCTTQFILPTEEKCKEFIDALNAENVRAFRLYGGQPIYMVPQIMGKRTVDPNGFPFNQFDEEIVYTPEMCPVALDLMARTVTFTIGVEHGEQEAMDYVNGIKKVAAAIL